METDPTETSAAQRKGKSSCLLVAGVLLVLLLVTAVGVCFWYNRPIEPVELTAKENQALEQKIDQIEAVPGEPEYQPGSKEIIITERELNGLLAQNTDLGDKLSFTLATDEIHARFETDMDEDLPVVGGKRLKAKARFLVKAKDGKPSLVLDDLTVWGASLPNDWLGGMKGKDLLSEIFGSGGGIRGIEELRIERGQLVIRLAE